MKLQLTKGFLTRVMFNFAKISVTQLLILSQILNESALLRIELIRARFIQIALNFLETIEFLKGLNLIEVKEDQVILKPKYIMFLNELQKSKQPELAMKSFTVSCLLDSQSAFSQNIYEFFSQFYWVNDQYESSPSSNQRLRYSGLRNFLIDLEFVYINSSRTKYIISDDYVLTFADLLKPKSLSPDGLLKIQQRKLEIGKAAELTIIDYERHRLSGFPNLAKMIEHVAAKNVMAGYDIKSYDNEFDNNGNFIPRYIEVKAVSPWDHKFYWSSTEIETSRARRQNYYLYLLPVSGRNEFDIPGLRIINDPYSNVYENENEWIRTEELLSFALFRY